jgi:hypothetical protein
MEFSEEAAKLLSRGIFPDEMDLCMIDLAKAYLKSIEALKRYADPTKWFTSFNGEECFILDEETFGNEVAQKTLLDLGFELPIPTGSQPAKKK